MAIKTYNAKIAGITQETALVKTYTIDLSEEMDFLPGQFVMVEFASKLPGVRRAYSISSSPLQKKSITITLKQVGIFSTEMDKSSVGEKLIVKGPFGHFALDNKITSNLVFVAGGTGVTPFRSMIHYILENNLPNRMALFYSSRTPEEFVFHEEMSELERKHPQLSVIFTATRCTDPSWKGFRERINADMIKRCVSDWKERQYYLCGPEEMVKNIVDMLLSMAISKEKIKAEQWG